MAQEQWGRRYRVTHLWHQVGSLQMWRSRCGQVVGFYEPDGDEAEPRCSQCAKSFKVIPALPPGYVSDDNAAAPGA